MKAFASYLIVLLLFGAVYWMTSPEYIGDTTRYAADAVAHAHGDKDAQFWEFGHLLWRPWGYAGYAVLGSRYEKTFGDTPQQATIRVLMQTNLGASMIAVVLMLYLCRLTVETWAAGTAVMATSCAAAFLNYSHSGAPYIPALMFSTLSLCWVVTGIRSRARGVFYALFSGMSFAIACALWFPYSFTGLGILAALYVWPATESRPGDEPLYRLRLMGSFLSGLLITAVLLFGAGAAADGIRSVPQLTQWIRESDNGWSQSMTATRAVTGLARSVWNFSEDAIFLKRWLLADPYNPAALSAWLISVGTKLVGFYVALAAVCWVLWNTRRRILVVWVAAIVPLLLFAILVFEPSSPERFLPVFPFACVAFAALFDSPRRYLPITVCTMILLAAGVSVNVMQSRKGLVEARRVATRGRIAALDEGLGREALVFLMTFNDDLGRFARVEPLDRTLLPMRFSATDTVEIASRRLLRWRAEFAERTLTQWADGKDVWLSERLFAPRPESSWQWVEGDDPRIRWTELPETFGRLECDLMILHGQDGFRRLASTATNRKQLAMWLGGAAASGTGEGHLTASVR